MVALSLQSKVSFSYKGLCDILLFTLPLLHLGFSLCSSSVKPTFHSNVYVASQGFFVTRLAGIQPELGNRLIGFQCLSMLCIVLLLLLLPMLINSWALFCKTFRGACVMQNSILNRKALRLFCDT